jgi:hypothetical protein
MQRPQSSTRKAIDQSVIGRRGERAFADLCERAGLRIAKPEPDMTGKDFLVEFPLAALEGPHTLDSRPIPLSCYVQVKTIAHKTDRIKLKLKAAERLVKESKPTFIAIVCLDENENVSNVCMIHVYDSIIISILKRLREEHAKKSFLIGNKYIYFNLNLSTRLAREIQAVRDFISIHISKGMIEYANSKNKQIVELGYDLNRYKINIQFDALSPGEFVDGLLGLRDLPTLQVEHFENRFGIALRADDHSIFERSTVKIQPNPAAKCRIALNGQSSKRLALLDGDLYFPGELAMNVGVRKLLVKSALINIIVDERGLNISMPETQRKDSYELSTFSNSYRMIDLLSSEPCFLNVTIEGMPDMFFPIDAPITGGDTKFFKAMLPVLEAAAQLRLRANAPDSPVYIDDIVRQRFDIMQANQALIERDSSIYFETGLPTTGAALVPADSLFTGGVAIGNSHYAYAIRARVEPTKEADHVAWSASDIVPLVIEILNGDVQEGYERFKAKTVAISGIKNIVSQPNFSSPRTTADS